ncbi:unnamed protein product [Ceratitis capitata]|uniref:(Mediterranean fruit fly) hypothetical protein n=1 Tax=Ceratitis capitata TaxID=7213 RepID=A0A811UFV4_CERCA|nr:unnamed protein product [Ceratitis capitata]
MAGINQCAPKCSNNINNTCNIPRQRPLMPAPRLMLNNNSKQSKPANKRNNSNNKAKLDENHNEQRSVVNIAHRRQLTFYERDMEYRSPRRSATSTAFTNSGAFTVVGLSLDVIYFAELRKLPKRDTMRLN